MAALSSTSRLTFVIERADFQKSNVSSCSRPSTSFVTCATGRNALHRNSRISCENLSHGGRSSTAKDVHFPLAGKSTRHRRKNWICEVSKDEIVTNDLPVSLGTAELPREIDIKRLETLMYQWASSLTQNANLPLPASIQVDKIDDGVRVAWVRVVDGKVELVACIDVTVTPGTAGGPPMFRAVRDGPFKDQVPPGEPTIMQSMLSALKQSVMSLKPAQN
eukprot:jgi/Mesen1/5465/ME000273S04700